MSISIFIFTSALSLFLTNLSINFFREKNIRQSILEEAPGSHMVKQGTPTMGGLAIVSSIILVMLYNAQHIDYNVFICILLLLGYAFIGIFDDLKKVLNKKNLGIKAGLKLVLQIVVASAFVGALAAGNNITEWTMFGITVPQYVYYVFLVVVIVGASNAVNLTDGLDGLAAGNLMIAFLGLLIFTFFSSDQNMLVLSICAIGGVFGFLWFNVNPARIFMGDTGSLALGALLAGIAIVLHKEWHLLVLGFIFVIEALSVILQVSYFKLTKGKRIFKMTPIHHHFELIGWTENKIVVRSWLISIIALLLVLKFG